MVTAMLLGFLIFLHGKTEKYMPDIKLMLSFHVETVVLMSRVEK
jgi:hypothetical protein